MTAQEKFENRIKELGIEEQEIRSNGYAGIQTDKEIIVLVHYYEDRADGYSEFRYPRFDAMSREQMDALTAHFASEFCSADSKEEAKFFSELANWCAGNGSTPLYPADLYLNIEPSVSIQFTDDEEQESELEYSAKLKDSEDELDIIHQYLKLSKRKIQEMIRMEFRYGHNLQKDFDPYPGWGSRQLCGYNIENKTPVVEEMRDGFMVLALYEQDCEVIRLHLTAADFPIEVLFNIYAQMK